MFSLQLEKHWKWQRKWGIEDLPREIFLTVFFIRDSDLEMWTQKHVFLFSLSCSDFCLFGILLKIRLYSLYLICLTHIFFSFCAKIFQNSTCLLLVYLGKQQWFGWLEMQVFTTAKKSVWETNTPYLLQDMLCHVCLI